MPSAPRPHRLVTNGDDHYRIEVYRRTWRRLGGYAWCVYSDIVCPAGDPEGNALRFYRMAVAEEQRRAQPAQAWRVVASTEIAG